LKANIHRQIFSVLLFSMFNFLFNANCLTYVNSLSIAWLYSILYYCIILLLYISLL